MKRQPLPADVMDALKAADRTPGWNNRAKNVRRFTLGACTLFVVPARIWAHRRRERQAAEFAQWQAEHAPCA